MQYIDFNGKHISKLGMGLMRLPEDPKTHNINEKEASKILDYCISNGINYFDTGIAYQNGTSESFVKKYLSGKYARNTFYLADKTPSNIPVTKVTQCFNSQLDNCGVRYFDFYLFHGIKMDDEYDKVKTLLPYLIKEKANNRIHNLGFSFHGSSELFDKITDLYKWDFCQIQINYLDWDLKCAKDLYEISVQKNIPCISMESLKGGQLAFFNKESASIINEKYSNLNKPKLGFDWLNSLDNLTVILSGMSSIGQVYDNINNFNNLSKLNESDYLMIDDIKNIYLSSLVNDCTHCNYCISHCKNNINIPLVLDLYYSKSLDSLSKSEIDKIKLCNRCCSCNNSCPQRINIVDTIENAKVNLK